MTLRVHLTEVPDDVRNTMSLAFISWEKQDLGIETVIDAMTHSQYVTQQTCKTLRSTANSIRVPALCRIVKAAHPARSMRTIFEDVALFLGLYEKSVQRLYYKERNTNVSDQH